MKEKKKTIYEIRTKILKALKSRPLGVSEICHAEKLSSSSVRYQLTWLEAMGLVEQVEFETEERRRRFWRLTPKLKKN